MLQEGSPSSIASNNIKAVYIDEKNDLVYIGTHTGGLTYYTVNPNKSIIILQKAVT